MLVLFLCVFVFWNATLQEAAWKYQTMVRVLPNKVQKLCLTYRAS